MTCSSPKPSPIPNFSVFPHYCKQLTTSSNLGSLCFYVKCFQLKKLYISDFLLFGLHRKTFSAGGMAPVGVDAAEEDVVSGVCHGLGVCLEETSLKKEAIDGNCFPP